MFAVADDGQAHGRVRRPAPTGKTTTWTGVHTDRYDGGKLVESWVDWDKYSWLEGLGLVGSAGRSSSGDRLDPLVVVAGQADSGQLGGEVWATRSDRVLLTTRLKTSLTGAIGNVLEWYDFAVFGFVAPFLSSQFFPASDKTSALIKTFGVFAVGYLARPLGGVLFGQIGDRFGRKRALQLSVAMMAIPTSLITVLPTHNQVGLLAPILLVLLRLAQGLSVGGELIGSSTYLVEIAEPQRRVVRLLVILRCRAWQLARLGWPRW